MIVPFLFYLVCARNPSGKKEFEMKEPKIIKSANNIMWVEYWVRQAHPSYADFNIEAVKYDCYRWICEIELPLINKTVKSISEAEVNAMCNAADKASKLIDEYIKSHREMRIENIYKNDHWIICGNEDGTFHSLKQNRIGNEKRTKEFKNETMNSLEETKKAINIIANALGSKENLFIQVIDQSLFSEKLTIGEILQLVESRIEKEYQTTRLSIYYDREGNSIIAVGYTVPKSTKGVYEDEKISFFNN